MGNWNTEEQIDMLLYSLRASADCAEERRNFNLCRATPFGRVADPSYCKAHALNLVGCFEFSKAICPEEFSNAKECLLQQTKSFLQWGSCEDLVESYTKCTPQ